jgi:hypothetical protein
MHVFDSPNHSGHLLKQCRGHSAPPRHIQYLHSVHGILPMDRTDAASCKILSGAGVDLTLRIFSTAQLVLDKEYSQGQDLEKKAKQLGLDSRNELLLPPMMATATPSARSQTGRPVRTSTMPDSLECQCHADSAPNVRACLLCRPVLVWKLLHCRYSRWHKPIYKYNVQSGLPRKS